VNNFHCTKKQLQKKKEQNNNLQTNPKTKKLDGHSQMITNERDKQSLVMVCRV
jgi:hypothetical protein